MKVSNVDTWNECMMNLPYQPQPLLILSQDIWLKMKMRWGYVNGNDPLSSAYPQRNPRSFATCWQPLLQASEVSSNKYTHLKIQHLHFPFVKKFLGKNIRILLFSIIFKNIHIEYMTEQTHEYYVLGHIPSTIYNVFQ